MSDERVIAASVTPVPFAFPRVIGANAYAELHGAGRTEWLVRATTDAGHVGITNAARFFRPDGSSVAGLLELLREVLVGRPVADLLIVDGDRVRDVGPDVREPLWRHGWLNTLALDLVARARGLSAIDLLGGRRRDWIVAYDTLLYFHDLLHPAAGVAGLAADARTGFEAGYRQFKVKVGRGGRWMTPEAGMRRDVEVIWAVRQAVGPDCLLMVDANFGYDGHLDLLADFVRETAAARLFWLEEMVSADLADYRTLRDLQARHCPDTLLTAGEVDRDPPSGVFPQLIEEELLDGYQPDILGAGLVRWLQLDTWLRQRQVKSIPHNFNNGNFGRWASLVFGAAADEWVTFEDEQPQPSVYVTEGLTFADGAYAAPTGPGLGLAIDEDIFQAGYAANTASIEI